MNLNLIRIYLPCVSIRGNKLLLPILMMGGLCAIYGCTEPQDVADRMFVHANIWTGNEQAPTAEAIAIRGDKILAIGTNQEVLEYRGGQTELVDASGNMIVPGFIDCHVHFMMGGFGLSSVQLRDASTPEIFSQRIQAYAQTLEPGVWVTEGNWDHELWGGELPQASWIDVFTPDNPVFVNRLDGHMALANSAAMKAAGIDKYTADVPGGTIVRDEKGNPTGIFKDNAMELVLNAMPAPSSEQEDQALRAAMKHVASNGVTSIHNMDVSGPAVWEVYQRAYEKGELITRMYVAVSLAEWENVKARVEERGKGDAWFRIGVLKAMVDGSLGSHTAAFFEPFTDAPEDRGFFLNSAEKLETWIREADQAGLHVAVHAIGDSAIHTLLDIFESVASQNGPKDRRFRMEHSQHIAPEDIARFSALGVIPSMQPYHAIDDGRWAEKVIGPERIKTTYAFRSLLDANAKLAFGSDWAVAPPTPLEGIYAAVTRRTLDGANPEGWVPEQIITVEEALKAYTISGAYASFEESLKGSLEVGKLADLVVLDRDIRKMDPSEIPNTQVLLTLVGGKLVYRLENP